MASKEIPMSSNNAIISILVAILVLLGLLFLIKNLGL